MKGNNVGSKERKGGQSAGGKKGKGRKLKGEERLKKKRWEEVGGKKRREVEGKEELEGRKWDGNNKDEGGEQRERSCKNEPAVFCSKFWGIVCRQHTAFFTKL